MSLAPVRLKEAEPSTARQKLPPASLRTARVLAVEGEALMLSGGVTAYVAVSCWIQPEAGDLVAYLGNRTAFVVHVLQRSSTNRRARVALPGIDELELQADQLHFTTRRALSLSSLGDCRIMAANGTLSIQAQELVSTVKGTALHVAAQVFTRAENICNHARHLFSAEAKRHLIVAEKEVRVDGEIIQMG